MEVGRASSSEGDASSASSASSAQTDDFSSEPMPLNKMMRVGMVAVFSAIGSMLFGLDIGYIGPVVESRSFVHDIAGKDQGGVPSSEEGLIVSLFSVAAICTSFPFVSSYFVDDWGRKPSIMIGSAVFIVGSIIQMTSNGIHQLLIGRFVSGMSIGLLSAVIVLYQSEMAPPSMRGALSTLYQLGISFGILVAAFIDELVVDRQEGWRYIMGIICLPALLLMVGMIFLPRSPRWLVQKGRRDEAEKVLMTIRAESEAQREEQEIYEEMERSNMEGELAWSELLRGRVARLLCLGVALQLLQQLVGMNAFMYFGPKIFKTIGFSPNKFNTINNFVNFLATLPAVLLADKAGRRSLMLWSSLGMTLACGLMGLMGLIYVRHMPDGSMQVDNANASWVISISAFFFVVNFAFGFGPIVWVYCAEIFPTRYRARCVGMTAMANWVGNTLIAQFSPMLLQSIQFSTFFVFGFFCVIGVALSAWLPETKGVPLEEVQELFDNKMFFSSTAEKESNKTKQVVLSLEEYDSGCV